MSDPRDNLRPAPPFQPGNTMAVRHGAHSERQIRPIAQAHRRSVLRRFGLLARDLTPVQRGYLDLYVRCMAKLDLYEAWMQENGTILNKKGDTPGFMRAYVSLMNSARLNLGRLEESLRDRVDTSTLAILEGEGRRVRLEAEARLGTGS